MTGAPARATIGRPAPATSDVETVAALLEAASFPLLVAGRGAVTSPGARAALEALAEHSGALLATSAMAHGLFAGLPYALGIAGGFASPLCVELAGAGRPRDLVRCRPQPLDGAARRALPGRPLTSSRWTSTRSRPAGCTAATSE